MRRVLQVYPDKAAAAEAGADRLCQAAGQGLQIALAGGSTPRDAYLIAAGRGVDFSSATCWLSDERCVPRDHEYSNAGMVDATLMAGLPEAKQPRFVPPRGEDGPDAGAASYEAEIRAALGGSLTPSFDLLLLGLGPDAHCASLFPSKPEWREAGKLVVGVPEAGMPPQVPRISFTLPLINAAKEVLFLVAGRDKQQAVERVFGPLPDLSAPAAHVNPEGGRVTVILDAPAAEPLPEEVLSSAP